MNKKNALRIALAVILVAAIVASFALLDARARLGEFLAWVQTIGPWGPVAVAVLYVPACIFFLPGSIITLGAGFAFGIVRAMIAVSIGSTVGATAAFLVGRTIARGWVEDKMAGNARFRAIDQAVGRQGFTIVLLTRLSPAFPFNVLNYAFGLTNVSLGRYVLASWIGMLPGTVMYVYLGSTVKNIADLMAGKFESSPGQTVLFFVGLLATVAVTVVVTRVAGRALKEAVAESEAEASGRQPPSAGEQHVPDAATRA